MDAQTEVPPILGLPQYLPEFTYTVELRVKRNPSFKRHSLLIEIWTTHQDGRRALSTVQPEPVSAASSAKSSIRYLVREAGTYVGTFSVTDREWSPESRTLVRALKRELGLAQGRTWMNVF